MRGEKIMCVIAYRPENAKISQKTLRTMFENNPDGAGLMYARDGKIVIIKGLMTSGDFLAACSEVPENVPCVYHCRIATHGSVRPGTCHPFPVTSDETMLNEPRLVLSKGYAVAHNGIISGMDCSRDFSDSQAFVRDILAPLSKFRSLHSKTLKPLIEKTIDHSRLCILDVNGRASLYGSGWIVDNSVFYSNSSYVPYVWRYDRKARARSFDAGIQTVLNAHGWEDGF